MRVLGIEASCDETAAAVYDGQAGLLAHELYSQVALHATYGGVVPELASRDHLRKLLPLLKKTVEQGGGRTTIDGIAYTNGPGLGGALLVVASVARSLAYGWDLPCRVVHHLEGQLLTVLIETMPAEKRAEAPAELMNGPVINSAGRADVVTTLTKVDDLLASLGF